MLWEAALTAGHHRLDNRVGILDDNGIQIDGYNKDIKDVSPLEDKFLAFRWAVKSIDGHDYEQIIDAFDWALKTKGKPKMIIAKTVMGKGVSIFENLPKYHGVAPSDEELKIALKELGEVA
jgi:transketolase